MKHVKLFENFINEGTWISLKNVEAEALMDLLDEIGVDFEDPGLSGGSSLEILGRITDEQYTQIKAKFPEIASDIDSEASEEEL